MGRTRDSTFAPVPRSRKSRPSLILKMGQHFLGHLFGNFCDYNITLTSRPSPTTGHRSLSFSPYLKKLALINPLEIDGYEYLQIKNIFQCTEGG